MDVPESEDVQQSRLDLPSQASGRNRSTLRCGAHCLPATVNNRNIRRGRAGSDMPEICIAAVEGQLLAEHVIEPRDAVVVSNRRPYVGEVACRVEAIAA